jgi:predicted TIM-barrel fold metal-dependent hydrolase
MSDARPGEAEDAPHPIIDCDVHPYVPEGIRSVFPYMTEAWRQRFIRKRAAVGTEARSLRFLHPNGTVGREDARPPNGGAAGSDPGFLCAHLLDAHGIDIAVLNNLQIGAICTALGSTDESIVLASAFNDFFLQEWMPRDRRLKFAMSVPSQDPEASAAEIRRIGARPEIAAIALPSLNILLGNRYWWPIYRAAQDMGLPILLHVTGPDSIYHGAPNSAGGQPDTYVERYVTIGQPAESCLNSIVFSGTLEKFTALKFLFVEYGFAWVVPLLWRMDRAWRELRHEVPWVRKPPTDYVRDRMAFATQPIDEPADPRDLDRMIAMLGTDLLCFSTDYPHWDNDMPGATLRSLPAADRRKVFSENARRMLRLS